MDNLQLSELAQKAKDGDMAAFEKIYIELSPDIYAIACEITKSKEESCDLMQDCFVAAMENIGTLKEPDKVKNWLIRIAANKSRDYIKKKKPSVLTEDQYEIVDNIEDEDISVIPEVSLETEERIEEVNEILGCLTEEKRLCLLLRFKYDMSYAEIANELGITESAVKSRISRAKDDIEKEAEKRKKKGLPLFGVAPFGLVIFALKKSAEASAVSFAGSTAQTTAFAGVTAASQAGIAAASTAATATSTTATAATGIGAKVAAMSVAQKVVAGVAAASIVTGSAVGTTVVVKNKIEANTTTAYVEEVTTAPDYGFESETVFIPAVAETESSTAELSTNRNSTSAAKQSTTVTQAKETEKSTVANKTTTKSTTKANTTTQKQTSTTTKVQTTTKAATTEKETATEEATTAKPTTTKAVTTAKATTTTTTKATTTTTTTESASPATVTVTVWGETSSTTKTLYFEAGETITASKIENKLSDEYGIEAIADDINITAEAGGSYTATAYE